MHSRLDFSRNNPLTVKRKPRLSLYVQNKAAQAAEEAWQQTVQGHNGPTVTNPTVLEIEQSSSASQGDDDDSEPTSTPLWKSRVCAPQLQAQLPLLSDRTRRKRLKNTLCPPRLLGSK